VEALHNEQANADFSVLCELLKDYVALIGAIKVMHVKTIELYRAIERELLNFKIF
jgi:sorting nexin-1/2